MYKVLQYARATGESQQSIFDQRLNKLIGQELVYSHESSVWKIQAQERLQELIRFGRDFTSEDIITSLERRGIVATNNKSLGAMMTAAARAGQIIKTNEIRESKLPRRHGAPLRVWSVK